MTLTDLSKRVPDNVKDKEICVLDQYRGVVHIDNNFHYDDNNLVLLVDFGPLEEHSEEAHYPQEGRLTFDE